MQDDSKHNEKKVSPIQSKATQLHIPISFKFKLAIDLLVTNIHHMDKFDYQLTRESLNS